MLGFDAGVLVSRGLYCGEVKQDIYNRQERPYPVTDN